MEVFNSRDIVTLHLALDAVHDLMGYQGESEELEDLVIDLHDLANKVSTALGVK